jgi:hypothetical protein
MRLMRLLRPLVTAVLLVMLGAGAAQAQYAPQFAKKKFGTQIGTTDRYRVLAQVAATAAVGSRTFTLDVRTFSKLSILVDLNGYVSGTAITLTCSWSLDRGTTFTRVMSTAVASGAGTLSKYIDTYAGITGVDQAGFEYDVRTYDSFRCIVAITGGAAGDIFDVYATAASGA